MSAKANDATLSVVRPKLRSDQFFFSPSDFFPPPVKTNFKLPTFKSSGETVRAAEKKLVIIHEGGEMLEVVVVP